MKECAQWSNDGRVGASATGVNVSGTPTCLEWKTTTPGSIIAAQVSAISTTNIRQLANADAINETLGRFFVS
jgi:hypothetical protein